jgi:dTDP-glucose 4,6-dehydratase
VDLLITGICGFIGSHLAREADKRGMSVIGIDNFTYAARTLNVDQNRICVAAGDVADLDVIRHYVHTTKPKTIIHLAAETHVARSIDLRGAFIRTNVEGTRCILDASLEYFQEHNPEGFKFIYVSTDEVYGSLGLVDRPWTETSPHAPNNPYAASKAAGDHLVRSYSWTFGLPAIITHSSNNYGPMQHPEKFIPTLVQQCRLGQPMTIHGTGRNIRDWLHVDDHCDALLATVEKGRAGETYNFGGRCEMTNEQVALHVGHAFSKITDQITRMKFVDDRPGNDFRYSSRIDKAIAMLKWTPRKHFTREIANVVQWYVDNPNYGAEYEPGN